MSLKLGNIDIAEVAKETDLKDIVLKDDTVTPSAGWSSQKIEDFKSNVIDIAASTSSRENAWSSAVIENKIGRNGWVEITPANAFTITSGWTLNQLSSQAADRTKVFVNETLRMGQFFLCASRSTAITANTYFYPVTIKAPYTSSHMHGMIHGAWGGWDCMGYVFTSGICYLISPVAIPAGTGGTGGSLPVAGFWMW